MKTKAYLLLSAAVSLAAFLAVVGASAEPGAPPDTATPTATASPTATPSPSPSPTPVCQPPPGCLQNQLGTATPSAPTQTTTGSGAVAAQTPEAGGQSGGAIAEPAQPVPPATICGPDRDACAGSGPGLPTPYPPLDLTHGAPSGTCLRYVRTPGGGPVELHLSWCGTTIDVTPVPAGR